MQRVILKLSGEALSPQRGNGIDASKVKSIAEEIVQLTKLDVEVGVVIGAGNIWRGRDAQEFMMDRVNADYMGMLATVLNCLALKNTLINLGVDSVVMTSLAMPSIAEPYVREKALKHLNKKRVVIFGGGTGSPLFSTDTCAALKAREVNASVILMAKNGVDGVYSDDPRINNKAIRYATLTYNQVLNEQLHFMDLTAATLCNENDIKTIVFDMNKKGNITKVITNPEIGTIITK